MLPRALSKRDIHCSQFSEWLMGNTTDWLINSKNNHQLQPQSTSIWDHTASASQRIFTAIAVGTRGLKRCQLCQSDNWNLATSLDIIWLNVWSAVFLILCEFVLCCQSYWLFVFFYVVRVVIVYLCISAKPRSSGIQTCFTSSFNSSEMAEADRSEMCQRRTQGSI